ncbi:hypothetical protein C8F04DRAFT_1254531 [Mycena alexandri]|uniref:Plastocyanin-like domain-containing protein n=1 Tax=Mycena alexandri TaxID=1745969 RepID=A0AAD6T940_9AGAR|nr:hypothetical protein C8F04DRAFT_1254531 [Mycena alexandri]
MAYRNSFALFITTVTLMGTCKEVFETPLPIRNSTHRRILPAPLACVTTRCGAPWGTTALALTMDLVFSTGWFARFTLASRLVVVCVCIHARFPDRHHYFFKTQSAAPSVLPSSHSIHLVPVPHSCTRRRAVERRRRAFPVRAAALLMRGGADTRVIRDVVSTGPDTTDNTTCHFVTNNTGPWFLHCHIDLHLEAGLAIVLVEDANTITKSTHPPAWDQLCPIYDALTPDQL